VGCTAFVPVAENIQDQIASPTLRDFICRVMMGFWRRGIYNPSIRQLMAKMKKSRSQIKRYIREAARLGLMTWQEFRQSFNRNTTNTYTPVACVGGVGFKNEPEKKGEFLKTTTPAPGRVAIVKPAKSYEALQWTLRKAHDALDALRMRGEYADKGKLWYELKQWREGKARERCRMAMMASVGSYTVTTPPPTEAQEREWEAAREREHERIAAEKAEAERVRVARDRANREAYEERERAAGARWDSMEMVECRAKLNRMIAAR
jgi:hypothetical protein